VPAVHHRKTLKSEENLICFGMFFFFFERMKHSHLHHKLFEDLAFNALPCAREMNNYFETWHLQLQAVINICDDSNVRANSWKTGPNTNTLQFEVFLEFFFVEDDSMHFCQ
jgi:hypothetical protein